MIVQWVYLVLVQIVLKSNMYQNPMEGRFCVCKSPILSVSWTESPNAAKQQALSYNFAGLSQAQLETH